MFSNLLGSLISELAPHPEYVGQDAASSLDHFADILPSYLHEVRRAYILSSLAQKLHRKVLNEREKISQLVKRKRARSHLLIIGAEYMGAQGP